MKRLFCMVGMVWGLASSLSAQEKYALLIGINYTHLSETVRLADGRVVPGGRLYGPLNVDLPRVEKLLQGTFGFKPANVKVLAERAATKQGILEALESHLVERVKPGDLAVFYFSGHGNRAPSGRPDEPYDELICPVDFALNQGMAINSVTDKMLKAALERIAAKTGAENVLAILDSCHSGTATRSLFEGYTSRSAAAVDTAVPRHFPTTSYWELNETRSISGTRAAGEIIAFGGASEATMKHLLIAACDRNETGKDNKSTGGFLTFALCNALEQNPRGSYAEVIQKVTDQVNSFVSQNKTSAQSPQLEGPSASKQRPVLTPVRGLAVVAAPPPPPPPLVSNQIVAATAGGPVIPVIPLEGLNQIGPIALKVALDKREYREGERMRITVTADRDCYLRIYNLNPLGRAVQLFPNHFQTENRVRGGQTVVIPGGANAPFDLEIAGESKGEFGNELVNVLASETQWSDLANLPPGAYARGIGGRFLNVTKPGPAGSTRTLTLAETFIQGANVKSIAVVGRPAVQVYDISASAVGLVTRPGPNRK